MTTTLANPSDLSAPDAPPDGLAPEPTVKIRPPSGWAALNLAEVWRFRDLLLALAGRDLKLRYKQTALGVAWVVLQPLLAAGIFTFVFGAVAKLPSDGRNYFVFSYAGLLGWNLFNNVLGRSSGCLVGNSHLISKVFFPRLVLPLSTVPSVLVDFAVALGMMAVLLLVTATVPTAGVLLLPLWMAILLGLSLGAGLVAAALTVSYRDVQYVLPVVTQLLLYGSPVAYGVAAVPANLRVYFYLNPLTPVLEGFRWSLLGTDAPSAPLVAYAAALAAALFVAGAFMFKRMERRFADVI